MKLGQLTECNVRNIFAEKLCRKSGREIVPDLFLFFKKVFYLIQKQVISTLVSIYFGSAWPEKCLY